MRNEEAQPTDIRNARNMQSMEIDSPGIDEVYTTTDHPQRQYSGKRRRRRPRWIATLAGALLAVPLWIAIRPLEHWGDVGYIEEEEFTVQSEGSPSSHGIVLPQILLDDGIYEPTDFRNAIDIAPPYWNATTPLFKRSNAWGPCYKPEKTIYWSFHSDEESIANTTLNVPLDYKRDEESRTHDWQNAAGLCRPGFLILGAGKCGTSSLYHYLVDHPKVLPAIEKQIHYFRVRFPTVRMSLIPSFLRDSFLTLDTFLSIILTSQSDGIIPGFQPPRPS